MIIKSGYVVKKMNDFYAVVPVDRKNINFSGMMTFNQSGKYLFDALQNESSIDDLVNVLLEHYDIDEPTAKKDVLAFVDKLKEYQIIIES